MCSSFTVYFPAILFWKFWSPVTPLSAILINITFETWFYFQNDLHFWLCLTLDLPLLPHIGSWSCSGPCSLRGALLRAIYGLGLGSRYEHPAIRERLFVKYICKKSGNCIPWIYIYHFMPELLNCMFKCYKYISWFLKCNLHKSGMEEINGQISFARFF